MNKRWSRRLPLLAYFCLGSAAGVYLVYLLVREFGSAQSFPAMVHALPVTVMVIVYFMIPLWAATQSWRLLFPRDEAPPVVSSVVLTWIGLSVNWLLPVALVSTRGSTIVAN